MRRILFAGPSAFGLEIPPDIELRPPAKRGDLLRAVADGAGAIGLVDGLFGDIPSVGHKEILFALARCIAVVGGASLGAIRAAECSRFGMEGVGQVFEAYKDSARIEDADVALLHAPVEQGYQPLTVALVEAEATLVQAEIPVGRAERCALMNAATGLHFSRRTWRAVVTAAGLADEALICTLKARHVRVKTMDADRVMQRLRVAEPPPNASFEPTIPFMQDVERYAPDLRAQIPFSR